MICRFADELERVIKRFGRTEVYLAGPLQEFVVMKEEGQVMIHTTNTWGEKTMSSTAAEGRDVIRQELQQLQADWERMLSQVCWAT